MNTKILAFIASQIVNVTSGRILGRKTTGTGVAELLTGADVREIADVYSTGEVDAAIAAIELTPGPPGADGAPGATGPAGPNEVTTATETNLTGILRGDGLNVQTVTIGTGLTLSAGELSASGGSGIGGSTGATDNAILRADGTGGATLQTSNLTIADLFTASPNNVVNYVGVQVAGGSTNVGLALVPKGTGAFSLSVPDGTAAGGNARGANAIDLQTTRSAATQVAGGTGAIAIGRQNTASWITCISIGLGNNTSNTSCIAIGENNTASGVAGVAIGRFNSVGQGIAIGTNCTATVGFSIATGSFSVTRRIGWRSHATDSYDVQGGAQLIECTDKQRGTGSTPLNWEIPLVSGNSYAFNLLVSGINSTGGSMAVFSRRVVAKNVGGTITLVSIQTIGTDYEDNSATDLSITASGSNIVVSVTGVSAETWRWQFALHGVEIKFGT